MLSRSTPIALARSAARRRWRRPGLLIRLVRSSRREWPLRIGEPPFLPADHSAVDDPLQPSALVESSRSFPRKQPYNSLLELDHHSSHGSSCAAYFGKCRNGPTASYAPNPMPGIGGRKEHREHRVTANRRMGIRTRARAAQSAPPAAPLASASVGTRQNGRVTSSSGRPGSLGLSPYLSMAMRSALALGFETK